MKDKAFGPNAQPCKEEGGVVGWRMKLPWLGGVGKIWSVKILLLMLQEKQRNA